MDRLRIIVALMESMLPKASSSLMVGLNVAKLGRRPTALGMLGFQEPVTEFASQARIFAGGSSNYETDSRRSKLLLHHIFIDNIQGWLVDQSYVNAFFLQRLDSIQTTVYIITKCYDVTIGTLTKKTNCVVLLSSRPVLQIHIPLHTLPNPLP